MATLTLTQMWIFDVVSQASLTARTDPDRPLQYTTANEVRIYAGGRRRAITHPGVQHIWGFELVQLFPTQVELLTGWLASGTTLFARDHRGHAMYGTFFELNVRELGKTLPYLYAASAVLHSVDAAEGV
jgi:hypothetical protein